MFIVLNKNNYIKAMSKTRLGNSIELVLPQDFNIEKQSCYKIIDNEFIFDSEKEIDYDKNELREKRESILEAFDIYKSNVNYGIEQEENKEDIINWYQNLLDLNEMAFNTIPIKIKKYMKGEKI